MKIISHHPAHLDEVLTQGSAIVNGKVFVLEGGKPTCLSASEHECNLFADVPGFEFLHEDGTKAGESKLREKPLGLSTITEALNNGKVTVEQLRGMDLQIPGIGSLNGLLDRAYDPNHSRATSEGQSPAELTDAQQAAAGLEQGQGQQENEGGDQGQGEGEGSQGDEEEEGSDQPGYLTKATIKAKLTELGIAFGPRDNRDQLLEKLNAAQGQGQQ